jgi:heme-degrading monooxygenase HmoA
MRVRVKRAPFKKGDEIVEVMHARVTHFQVLPGKFDEITGLWRNSVIPAAQDEKGFQGVLLLADRNTDKCIAITLWETEADMTMGEASGFYQQQLAKFKDVFGAPPVREHYEVVVQV